MAKDVTNIDLRIGRNLQMLRGPERSQQSLADLMRSTYGHKWSQTTVWTVEKGERPLKLSEARDLAGILECEVEDFFALPEEARVIAGITSETRRVRERHESIRQQVKFFGRERWRLREKLNDAAEAEVNIPEDVRQSAEEALVAADITLKAWLDGLEGGGDGVDR